MKTEQKAHLKIWLFVLGIVAAILATCMVQIHNFITNFIPNLAHAN
jgi:hypothetical protein